MKSKKPPGRPRTVSLPKKDMVKLGKEMVEWVKSNPSVLHLSEWYCIEKMYTDKQWDTMCRAPEFFPYYEQALKIVGRKYLDKNSDVREGVSQRWQRMYFKDLKWQEDEDHKKKLERELEKEKKKLEHEYNLKKAETLEITAELADKFDQYMGMLTTAQSARKIEDTSSNAEAKS